MLFCVSLASPIRTSKNLQWTSVIERLIRDGSKKPVNHLNTSLRLLKIVKLEREETVEGLFNRTFGFHWPHIIDCLIKTNRLVSLRGRSTIEIWTKLYGLCWNADSSSVHKDRREYSIRLL